MGCGCGGNKNIANVTRNNTAKFPRQSIQSLSNTTSTPRANPTPNPTSIQSLSVKQDLTSDERAREKKRREIMLKKLGRI